MMPFRSLTLVLTSLVIFAGPTFPAAAAPNKIYASSMQGRMQYRGFSVARPASPAWYLVPGEQSHTEAILRRDSPAGGTYSAFVSVVLRTLPRKATSEAGVIVIDNSARGTKKELSLKTQAEGKTIAEEVSVESAPGRP